MSPEKLHLEIIGMSCDGCKRSVTIALKNVNGVSEVNVSIENGTADVVFDTAQTGKQQIIEAVNNTGIYSAREL